MNVDQSMTINQCFESLIDDSLHIQEIGNRLPSFNRVLGKNCNFAKPGETPGDSVIRVRGEMSVRSQVARHRSLFGSRGLDTVRETENLCINKSVTPPSKKANKMKQIHFSKSI